ncbi:MAG: HpcH/HpaI aldolase/citrate lyase family protein [Arenicellales bacterium]|nr:HpcH/HpaI aldolase/citrate lyase family protein [Arenicellales bacterium]
MQVPVNMFKHALVDRRLQIGLWSQLVTPIATEVVIGAGFDFLVVDAEHAPNDVTTVITQLQIIDPSPASAVVRVPWNDMVLIKRYLDIGAQSLLIPFVESAEEATKAVSYTRYPPNGVRGVATCHRANRFGHVDDYLAKASEEICVLVQVETAKALENLEAIAAVDGVDGVFIGPSDLAASMGHLGNPGHPDLQAAFSEVPARLAASGKPAGILMLSEDLARRYIELGFTWVAVGSDLALLANQTATLASKFKPIP